MLVPPRLRPRTAHPRAERPEPAAAVPQGRGAAGRPPAPTRGMPSAFAGCDRLPHGAFLPVPPGRSGAGPRHAWPPPGLGDAWLEVEGVPPRKGACQPPIARRRLARDVGHLRRRVRRAPTRSLRSIQAPPTPHRGGVRRLPPPKHAQLRGPKARRTPGRAASAPHELRYHRHGRSHAGVRLDWRPGERVLRDGRERLRTAVMKSASRPSDLDRFSRFFRPGKRLEAHTRAPGGLATSILARLPSSSSISAAG